jgi:hypothetical protein
MSKNKPKETIEYVIRLQDKERQLLQDIATSYRIQALDIEGMLKILEDPTRIIQIAYGIATTLEIIGIETGFPVPTIVDVVDYLNRKQSLFETKETGKQSIFDLLKQLWTGGGYPGGY